MKKILVVAKDGPRRERVVDALLQMSCEVLLAPDGLYALTLLERNRAHCVLLLDELHDIAIEEFCHIVRKDPALNGIRLAALSSDGHRPSPADVSDLTFSADKAPVDLARDLLDHLASERGGGSSVAATTAAQAGASPATDDLDTLSGNLRILNLSDLTQAVSCARRTGRLTLRCPDGPGEVYFLDGEVIHADHLGCTGLPAFRWILTCTLAHPDVSFRFETLSKAEVFRCPRTINMTAERLLLSVAVAIDEDRAPGQGT